MLGILSDKIGGRPLMATGLAMEPAIVGIGALATLAIPRLPRREAEVGSRTRETVAEAA